MSIQRIYHVVKLDSFEEIAPAHESKTLHTKNVVIVQCYESGLFVVRTISRCRGQCLSLMLRNSQHMFLMDTMTV